MEEEMHALAENETWDLGDAPRVEKPIVGVQGQVQRRRLGQPIHGLVSSERLRVETRH